METFILVYFIFALLAIGEKMYKLSYLKYPHTKEIKKGEDISSLVIVIGLAIWSGYLIF